MSTASQIIKAKKTIEANDNEEMSLVEVLRARENGVDFRTAASMFANAVDHFEAKGHNLYRRMLLEPSDAEALVDYPHEAGERRMIMLASNNYLGLTNHPKVVEAACQAAMMYGLSLIHI